MGSQLASSIIDKAAIILFDVNNVKWSRAELLAWLNDAQRSLIAMVPEASSKTVSVKMVAGARQTIPADGYLLLEITRNMGTSGTVGGRVLKRIDKSVLDESTPDWSAATPVTPVPTYMYNLRDRRAFYVNPPSDGTGFLEQVYSQSPVTLVATDPILVEDIYVPALTDYLLWRAKSKAGLGDPGEAKAYYASFMTFVAATSTDAARLAGEMGALKETPLQHQGAIG